MLNKTYFEMPIYGPLSCVILAISEPNKLAKRYTIESLSLGSVMVACSWGQAVTFSEMFNAFIRNGYHKESRYTLLGCVFSLGIEENIPKIGVQIETTFYDDGDGFDALSVKYNKAEAMIIYNKITKILNKCDFGEHDGQAIR